MQEKEPGHRYDTECKGCKTPIVMVKLASEKWHPCDRELFKIVDGQGVIQYGLRSHFATCPKAENFRRKRDANAG